MKTIYLIRHAEKQEWVNREAPLNKQDFIDNHRLSLKGHERALLLASLFSNISEIVCQTADQTHKSQRCLDTIKHLSLKFNISPTLFTKSDIKTMLTHIHDSTHENILVCWNHDQLTDIVNSFIPSFDLHWKGKRFDVVWMLTINKEAVFSQYPMKLLYGDRDDVF